MARRFRLEWRISLLTALLLPTMIGLGFWQLERAEHNTSLLELAEARRGQLPVVLSTDVLDGMIHDFAIGDNDTQWQFQSVAVVGHWRDEVFLLENQTDGGRNGYHVIGVMSLAGSHNVLVNRGWVAAPPLRSDFPAVPEVSSGLTEVAEVYSSASLLADKPVYAEIGWPRRIGALHIPALARELGDNLLPFVLRLKPGSPSALTVNWPVVNISPEKNTAYAIQWFAMSAALVLLYLAFSFPRESTHHHEV